MTSRIDAEAAQKMRAALRAALDSAYDLGRYIEQLETDLEKALQDKAELEKERNVLRAGAEWYRLQGQYNGESITTPVPMLVPEPKDKKQKPKEPPRRRGWRGLGY